MGKDYYLKISKASVLKSSKERVLFRFLEIFPGALSWGTLILVVILSWKKPVLIAIFIIMFLKYFLVATLFDLARRL
jgi:hypothetical protein